MKFILITIGVITSLFYIIIFAYLVNKNVVFDGYLNIEYDFKTESPFISLLKPRGRIDQKIYTNDNSDYYQKLLVDPVYFDVKLPRSFKKALVEITYKNLHEPLLELGLSSGESPYFYLQPIENKLIDYIIERKNWFKVEENGVILLQKDPTFSSIKEFKNNIPKDKKVGVYNYDLPITYTIDNYKPDTKGLEINKSIRGNHEFYTYVGKNQDLDFNFNLQDTNRGHGDDPITIQVYYKDRQVYSKTIEDDGISDNSAEMSRPFDYNLLMQQPPEGLYKIKFFASDDIFIRQIKAKQHLISFINHIYLGDNVGYYNDRDPNRYEATELITNTEKLSAITSHKEGLQTISFGNKEIDIDERHIMFVKSYALTERDNFTEKINIPVNDIKISGKGLFSFSKQQYFDPTYINLTGDQNLDLEKFNIDYIIAEYTPAKKLEYWNTKKVEYDLTQFANKNNTYRFAFSFPYSKLTETEIQVSKINIELFAEPIGFTDFLKKSFNQISKFIND